MARVETTLCDICQLTADTYIIGLPTGIWRQVDLCPVHSEPIRDAAGHGRNLPKGASKGRTPLQSSYGRTRIRGPVDPT